MNPSLVAPPLNVPGWTPIFWDDFNTNADRGMFLTKYGIKWDAYPTGWRTSSPWKVGMYDNSILEARDSCLIKNIATVDGTPRVAALQPKLSPVKPYGVPAGRFSIRFKCDPLPGYKVAWLLWPDSGLWPLDGEIDFPESDLSTNDTVHGFVHRQDAITGSDQWAVASNVSLTDGEWHTCVINYKPGTWRTSEVSFMLDGDLIGKWTERIPNGPMHWVIQTEPMLRWTKPDPTVTGKIMIDWAVAYRPA
jgi:hypothetical protein